MGLRDYGAEAPMRPGDPSFCLNGWLFNFYC
jgi:hypothetical protein